MGSNRIIGLFSKKYTWWADELNQKRIVIQGKKAWRSKVPTEAGENTNQGPGGRMKLWTGGGTMPPWREEERMEVSEGKFVAEDSASWGSFVFKAVMFLREVGSKDIW